VRVFLSRQLQDEKKRLQDENDRFASDTTGLKKEVDELKVRLEETEWGLCQKSGELAHVKSQLKDTQVSADVYVRRSGQIFEVNVFPSRVVLCFVKGHARRPV